MAHITLNNENLPGIVGLLDYSPATAAPLLSLANTLLVSESTLTRTERELIAASVSWWNDCHFCHTSHAAAAVANAGADISLIDDIKAGLPHTEITEKLRALLNIAHHVQQGGKHVTAGDIEAARDNGATDREIHDTVLIAAAFCMYNRYVDGLGTWAPEKNEDYLEMGRTIAEKGYGASVRKQTESVVPA
ncbi:MAG TPA: peroxidase-related enzyme [Puia sp.]|nr:peroxidase-related enzyme [Puia sp.]